MGIIVNLYLWMFPLLLIFQSVLSSQKRKYVSENGELNQPLNYDLADDYRVTIGFALLLFLPFLVFAILSPLLYIISIMYYNIFFKIFKYII